MAHTCSSKHMHVHAHITWDCIALHYITLRYVTSHYMTLHFITIHYITFNFITLYTYIHGCTHTYMDACIQTYIHKWILTCVHTCMHTCMHACMHACIHTYMHAHTTEQMCVSNIGIYYILAQDNVYAVLWTDIIYMWMYSSAYKYECEST